MPVITFSISDLSRLVGKSMSVDDVLSLCSRVKGEVEAVEGDRVRMEVTSDRPDMFSVEGIARTFKGLLELELGLPKVEVRRGSVELMVDRVPRRQYITMMVVRDVVLDSEAIAQLIQLQEKIHQTYGRNRRRVAIGLYDLDLIKPPIRYTLEDPRRIRFRPIGEAVEIDGHEILTKTEKGRLYSTYALHDDGRVPILKDSEGRALVIIPVVENYEFQLTERTRNVLVDVTSSDDLRYAHDMMKIVVYSLLERSRSKIVEIPLISTGWTTSLEPRAMTLSSEMVYEYLGLRLSSDDVKRYLMMSRHDVDVSSNGELIVKVAPYRINVLHAVDLVEDVAIAYGYDRIPREMPEHTCIGSISRIERLSNAIRELMIGLGFQEVVNYMLTSRSKLVKARVKDEFVELLNPKSELFNAVRCSIWPQLLEIASQLRSEARLFEVGDVVKAEDANVVSERMLSFLMSRDEITLTDGLVVLKALLRALGVSYKLSECKMDFAIPERTACVYVNNVCIGFVAEIEPEVLEAFNVEYPCVVCEISVTRLLDLMNRR